MNYQSRVVPGLTEVLTFVTSEEGWSIQRSLMNVYSTREIVHDTAEARTTCFLHAGHFHFVTSSFEGSILLLMKIRVIKTRWIGVVFCWICNKFQWPCNPLLMFHTLPWDLLSAGNRLLSPQHRYGRWFSFMSMMGYWRILRQCNGDSLFIMNECNERLFLALTRKQRTN